MNLQSLVHFQEKFVYIFTRVTFNKLKLPNLLAQTKKLSHVD